MCIVDDPTLALIARFVVNDIDNISISDENYLKQQLVEIRNHIGDATGEDRNRIAMAWIREHAERYRSEWLKKKFSKILHDRKCPDCPLFNSNSTSHCIIHRRWIGLLEEYLADEINSDRYIEETLKLLKQHKQSLKVSLISGKL